MRHESCERSEKLSSADRQLVGTVDEVNRAGYRIKVAVISSRARAFC
jgi:hypothetical protein